MLVAIVVFSATGIWVYSEKAKEEVEAVAGFDADIIWVGDQVQFTSDGSKGAIKAIEWDFGDGRSSELENPSHTYDIIGWYNVTLTVTGVDGLKDNDTVRVGVQRENVRDELHKDHEDSINMVAPLSSGFAMDIEIGPSIGLPTGSVECLISNAVADITFELQLLWDTDGNKLWDGSETVFSQTYSAVDEDVVFNRLITPEELNDEARRFRSELYLVIDIYGVWESIDVELGATFPVTGL